MEERAGEKGVDVRPPRLRREFRDGCVTARTSRVVEGDVQAAEVLLAGVDRPARSSSTCASVRTAIAVPPVSSISAATRSSSF
jgi:hypothetical protein